MRSNQQLCVSVGRVKSCQVLTVSKRMLRVTLATAFLNEGDRVRRSSLTAGYTVRVSTQWEKSHPRTVEVAAKAIEESSLQVLCRLAPSEERCEACFASSDLTRSANT